MLQLLKGFVWAEYGYTVRHENNIAAAECWSAECAGMGGIDSGRARRVGHLDIHETGGHGPAGDGILAPGPVDSSAASAADLAWAHKAHRPRSPAPPR